VQNEALVAAETEKSLIHDKLRLAQDELCIAVKIKKITCYAWAVVKLETGVAE